MKAERLLAHFKTISEAPDAVARLRRFILDLAVRGKLVEQDPEDEPAEEQLERITLAKLSLGRKERAIRKKKADTSIEPFHHVLPDGWVTAALADLVTILNGRAYKQTELLESGTPVLRVGNLFTSNKWYYSDLELEDDKYCDDGDLIFAWSASFGPFIWSGGRVIYHYHIWKLPLHSPSDLSRDYLHLYLLQKTSEIKSAGHGISMVHMTKEKMEQLEVPLPPLAEQHRIVAKVDELMALCDQLEAARQQREQTRERLVAASLQRLNQPSEDPASFRQHAQFALQTLPTLTTTPAQIKHLRQTILNLAVRGKLVEQDPEDEPAEGLSKIFKAEKTWLAKTGQIRKPKQLSEVNHDDLPMVQGWLWERLGCLSTVITKGSTPTSYGHAYTEAGVSFVKVESIKDGALRPSGINSFISPGTNEFLSRSRLEAGDILFSIAGSIGTCAIVEESILPANTNQALAIIRGTQMVFNPGLLLAVLRSSLAQSVLLKARGVAMNNVSLDDIQNLVVPLPPLAEQHRIVAKVDELMALCDQLEQQLSQADQQRRRLLEALLAEAFREPEKALASVGSA